MTSLAINPALSVLTLSDPSAPLVGIDSSGLAHPDPVDREPVQSEPVNGQAIAHAAQTGALLLDRSDWTWLRLTGDDRLNFLHNQTTHSFKPLQPGQGREAVVVTSTGRTIDLVVGYVFPEAVEVLASPGLGDRLLAWFDRYLFPADRVSLADRSAETATFSLLGPQSLALLDQIGVSGDEDLATLPPHHHRTLTWQGEPLQIAAGSGLAAGGWTLWLERGDRAQDLSAALAAAGAQTGGAAAWEALRVLAGRPAVDRELTEEYNALEAGLRRAISFDKGCYIGQETIARLDAYKGVKQQLWGFAFGEAIAPGTLLYSPEAEADPSPDPEPNPPLPGEALPARRAIGRITSCLADPRPETPPGRYLALGYLKTKAGNAPGVSVLAATSEGDRPGETLALPWAAGDR